MTGRSSPDWFDMDETEYRASQICRILGNPKIYQIIKAIERSGDVTPTELASRIGRSLTTTCVHMKSLRQTQLVRYVTEKEHTRYRIKFPRILNIMKQLEGLVEEVRKQQL